jgi:four helix bundle protein
MSQHTPHRRRSRSNRHHSLPRGATRLHTLEIAIDLAGAVQHLEIPRGCGHLRDHLVRAADNTALRLAEASGRTLGNRRQHLEAAYAENQEVQCDLLLIRGRGANVADAVLRLADRLGGMIYGLLRVEDG